MRAIWISAPLVLLAATAQAADVWEVYPFDQVEASPAEMTLRTSSK